MNTLKLDFLNGQNVLSLTQIPVEPNNLKVKKGTKKYSKNPTGLIYL